jgi:hypothetical protein
MRGRGEERREKERESREGGIEGTDVLGAYKFLHANFFPYFRKYHVWQ